jgi:coenzyme PQQ precursor peptide PqqA
LRAQFRQKQRIFPDAPPKGSSTERTRFVNISRVKGSELRLPAKQLEMPMSWTTPIVVEVCAGLEVTAYLTAEM